MRLTIGAIAGLALASSALAQTDTLYVTDGDSSRLAIVQGGIVQAVKTTHPGAYPIAVSSSIWLGRYFGTDAREYDLNGDPTGNTAVASFLDAVDGTTDGFGTNYVMASAFSSNGAVYKTDSQFGNATFLFNTPNMSRSVGITWDPTDSTLWVSGDQEIRHYDLVGNLIGGFANIAGDGTLAYEPSTDTLWHVRGGLTQYDKSGVVLQQLSPNGLASNNWGAEFAMRVPAPGAAALLGLGGLIAGCRRR